MESVLVIKLLKLVIEHLLEKVFFCERSMQNVHLFKNQVVNLNLDLSVRQEFAMYFCTVGTYLIKLK